MRIANPLYDHAFKYLMANRKLAKKVIATILDEEVIDLDLHQQEIVVDGEEKQFTLFRLDFKALIAYRDGRQETVLIELQKSRLPTNVLRFRSYLGHTYAQSAANNKQAVYPIISIYILGYKLADLEVMAALVDRKIMDASTKEELDVESDFIDLLTHKCYILQAGRLPAHRRTRLEKFMMLFNQAWISERNFILDLEEVPDEFQDIASYLQRPLQDKEIRKKLALEAEAEMVFAMQEARVKQAEQRQQEEAKQRLLAEQRQQEAEQRQEQAEQRQQEAEQREQEESKQRILAEQRQQEAEQRQQEESKQRILAEQREQAFKTIIIQKLYETQIPLEEIARMTDLSIEQVKEILTGEQGD